jgi:hypothetical protein
MSPSMPSLPDTPSSTPQPSDFYSPKNNPSQPVLTQPNPIQLQSASIPAAPPAKKAFRPFSEAAKPRQSPAPTTDAPPQGQPQWEGSLQMQPVEQANGGWLPTLPK